MKIRIFTLTYIKIYQFCIFECFPDFLGMSHVTFINIYGSTIFQCIIIVYFLRMTYIVLKRLEFVFLRNKIVVYIIIPILLLFRLPCLTRRDAYHKACARGLFTRPPPRERHARISSRILCLPPQANCNNFIVVA